MKFVTLVKFTPSGISQIGASPQRAMEFAQTAKSMGCLIDEILWTQGEYDGIILFAAPDPETAAATMLKFGALGNVTTTTMVAFDAQSMTNILAKQPV